MPTFYPENNAVLPSDDKLRTLHKIASLISSGAGGSGGVFMDRDPLPPDNVTKGAISYNSTTGVITQWRTDTQVWQ